MNFISKPSFKRTMCGMNALLEQLLSSNHCGDEEANRPPIRIDEKPRDSIAPAGIFSRGEARSSNVGFVSGSPGGSPGGGAQWTTEKFSKNF